MFCKILAEKCILPSADDNAPVPFEKETEATLDTIKFFCKANSKTAQETQDR